MDNQYNKYFEYDYLCLLQKEDYKEINELLSKSNNKSDKLCNKELIYYYNNSNNENLKKCITINESINPKNEINLINLMIMYTLVKDYTKVFETAILLLNSNYSF